MPTTRAIIATGALAAVGAWGAGAAMYAGSMSVEAIENVGAGASGVSAACSRTVQVDLGEPRWSSDRSEFVIDTAVVSPADTSGCAGHRATVTLTDSTGQRLAQGSRELTDTTATQVAVAPAAAVSDADGIAVLIQ